MAKHKKIKKNKKIPFLFLEIWGKKFKKFVFIFFIDLAKMKARVEGNSYKSRSKWKKVDIKVGVRIQTSLDLGLKKIKTKLGVILGYSGIKPCCPHMHTRIKILNIKREP